MMPDVTAESFSNREHDAETQQPRHQAQDRANGHDEDHGPHHEHDCGDGPYH